MAKHTSTHSSLNHFSKNFLCSVARRVQAAKGQMCSSLNTLKARKKKPTMGLFLQSKHHQILPKFFHLGLKPVQLRESGDWSCTAQLSTVQLCLSQARTPCWITAVRTALLLRERGKIRCRSPPVLCPASLLSRHCPAVFLDHPPWLSLWRRGRVTLGQRDWLCMDGWLK